MSLKSLLMPVISRYLLAEQRLLRQRTRAEQARVRQRRRHEVHYFHQADDPYSALAAASLPALLARYDIDLKAHVVSAPPDAAAPERDKLIAYSRKDAKLLALRFGLDFRDAGGQPAQSAVKAATSLLVAAAAAGRFVDVAGAVSTSLWRHLTRLPEVALPGGPLAPATPPQVEAHLDAANQLRKKLGHYLGAMFYYAGEWYWGLDRLHYLEQRLQTLGAQRGDTSGVLFAPAADLQAPLPSADPSPIDFFFSLRSPYSAIVAPRIFELGRLTGAEVRLRFVLPMVMRGLPVPREKRTYISLDTAREARARGIAFGCLNDPVGRPTERGLALMPYAQNAGKGEAYVLSFMTGVWAEGIDAGSDRGLRKIIERAGLSWDAACIALQDESWRVTAENNRTELFSLGLWGVPSFKVDDTAVWGQDRLWAIEAAIRNRPPPAAPSPDARKQFSEVIRAMLNS
jgi:2-hydroxychromene-2-carboxylate isomerase